MTYFRITAHSPKYDICMIADSNGKFEKKWQFSAFLVAKGFDIIEVNDETNFEDGNFSKAVADSEHIIVRACMKGRPTVRGAVIEVNGRNYISNKRR